MDISITHYNACCNLGANIDEIYKEALAGNGELFDLRSDIIKGKNVRAAQIKTQLPVIEYEEYNLRCNRILLSILNPLENDIRQLIKKYTD